MYTTVTGKKFLKVYNKREKKSYSGREFFEKIFLPLFFDHKKYMMTGGNSPLENPKISWKKGDFPSKENRKERCEKIIEKIETTNPDASIAMGFPTLDYTATTSGQVSDFELNLSKDDAYLSWIGSALGIGVSGGLIMLIDKPEILLKIFDGWEFYRVKYLNNAAYTRLRGNQITTWNGQWLYAAIEYDDVEKVNLFDLEGNALNTLKNGGMEFKTIGWSNILFSLSKFYGNDSVVSYIYNLSQTNTTIGFIPINLYQIRKPIQLYKIIFSENDYLKDSKKIETIFGSAYGLAYACRTGQIGIKALEPKGLKQFMIQKNGKVKFPDYNKADEEQIINYNTYITWVLAMLDNEKMWELTGSSADDLINLIKTDKKTQSRQRVNVVEQLLKSKSKKQFLELMIPILDESKSSEVFVQLGKTAHEIVASNFSYFLVLLRFRYAEKKNK